MPNLIAGVKKFSAPMFFIFAFSKVLVGVGLGVLLIQYFAPYGWLFLIAGVVLSLLCLIFALKKG